MRKRRYRPLKSKIFEIIMIIAAIAFIYPAVFVFFNAFKTDAAIKLQPLSPPTTFHVENFIKAWTEMQFPITIANTFIITALGVAGIILVSSMAAYMLARTINKLSWVVYMLFTFALVIPFQIIMVPIVVLATDLNLHSIWGIIPMYWGLGCPLAVFMYHGFVKSVPQELEESASIDGAGRYYIYFRIVFPLLAPITATLVILNSLWIWNDFLLPLIIVQKGTLQLEQMQFYGMFLREYGPAAASLVLSASPIIVFYLFLQKHIVKGIAAGAIKG